MNQVGRYQIIEELGRGSQGVVYKAMDPAIGRTVAIKSIALNQAIPEERERVREDILREARLAGTLSNPNIITLYDVQDDGGSVHIFMEYVDGKSLEWAISSTRAKRPDALSRDEFLVLFRQVAGALDYAHRKGVIHRDVKPANIVLTGRHDGELTAKIADFGVARFVSPNATQSLTGTPNYMSPEQIQGGPSTGASDQFSLACIAYEVFTGRRAFAAETIEALLYKIRNEMEEPVDKVNPTLSPAVGKVMQRAMAKDPAQRFGSCSEFAGALEFALGDSRGWLPGETVKPADQIQTLPFEMAVAADTPLSTRKKAALIMGLGLAVALAILLIVRMNSGPPVPTQVLDTSSGSVAPPPTVDELKADKHPVNPPPDLSASTSKPVQQPLKAAEGPPTVVNVPVPSAAMKKLPQKATTALRPVRQFTHSESPAMGDVQINSDPPGATIMLDGISSCVTPCSVPLPGGRHTLTATMDGFGIARRIFNVPADNSVFIPMVKSEGVLVLSSNPPGAEVNVDGRDAGRTPLTLHLSAGTHNVNVWDGSKWRNQTVEVSSDTVSTRTVVF